MIFQELCEEITNAKNLKSIQLKSDKAEGWQDPGRWLAPALKRCPKLQNLDLCELTFWPPSKEYCEMEFTGKGSQ